MELLSLFQAQQRKASVGTLLLGERNRFREIFFEKDQVYLCGDHFSGKIDMAALASAGVLGTAIAADDLDGLIAGSDLKKDCLPSILISQSLIDQQRFETLVRSLIKEEILDLLFRNGETFHFQDKRVPEQLLEGGGITACTPIPLAELIPALEKRIEAIEVFKFVLPSRKEIFVKTAEGMAYLLEHPEDHGLARIFTLIDGFRDLQSLVECSRCYEHYVLDRIHQALEKEFLKKTILPEIKGISPESLTADEAARYMPYFRNAVKHAVDAMEWRERLAHIYEKTNEIHNAVVQYNFVGDAFYRMRKPAKAIAIYQRALEIKPDDLMVTEKISRIYHDAAEQEILKGDIGQAIQLLENALATRPDDPVVFERLTEILISGKQIQLLTEVCDRVVAHAKKVANIEIGLAACRHVLRRLPDNPIFQKKLVNVFLDFGEVERAAEAMAGLARTFAAKGQSDRALELAEKIKRLRNAGPESARIYKALAEDLNIGSARRRRRRIVASLFLALMVLFGAYQALSYTRWVEIKSAAVAFAHPSEREAALDAAAAHDPLAILEPDPSEEKHRFLIQRYEDFSRQFPLSLFNSKASKLATASRLALEDIEGRRRQAKQDILDRAALHALEGDVTAVKEALTPLLDDKDSWGQRARARLKDVEAHELSAKDLFNEASRLERLGEWRQAHAQYTSLRKLFPRSQLTRKLKLPILVESIPPRVDIHRVDAGGARSSLGTTPAAVRVEIGTSVKVELSSPGHRRVVVDLTDRDGNLPPLLLDREPLWIDRSAGAPTTTPSIVGSRAYLNRSGVVRAVDLQAKRAVWQIAREEINWLLGPPLVTSEGVYLVWNDQRVVLVDHASEGAAPDAEPKTKAVAMLRGLARTGALALEDGSLLVGTNRKTLRVFQRGDLQPLSEVQLEDVPSSITPLGRSSAAVLCAGRQLVAVEVPKAEILWRKELSGEPIVPPRLVGSSLVLVSSTRDLIFLDPKTGLFRQAEPLASDTKVAFDSATATVHVLERDGALRSLSPVGARPIAKRSVAPDSDELWSIDGRIAILYEDRKRVLVLDPLTLSPLWGAASDEPIAVLAGNQEYLVAFSSKSDGKTAGTTQLRVYDAKPDAPPTPPAAPAEGPAAPGAAPEIPGTTAAPPVPAEAPRGGDAVPSAPGGSSSKVHRRSLSER